MVLGPGLRTGGGPRFDSRLAQVTFLGHVRKTFLWIFTHVGPCWGTLLRGVGVTFWSGRGHFFVIFGMSWEVSGSGLGMFLDRFGKILEKMSDGVRKSKFSKMTGSIFPESGRFRIAFLAYPRTEHIKKTFFCLICNVFPYMCI